MSNVILFYTFSESTLFYIPLAACMVKRDQYVSPKKFINYEYEFGIIVKFSCLNTPTTQYFLQKPYDYLVIIRSIQPEYYLYVVNREDITSRTTLTF